MLVLFAAVPVVVETDVGKVQAKYIGAIGRRLKQVLGSNILDAVNEETLHSLYPFLLRRDRRT